MHDRFSLLTRLPWRFGFNSRGLKSIDLISSSADVRHSMGEFNRIQRLITTNPASIGSQLCVNAGESWWTQDLPSKSLILFTIRSKVKRRRENTSVFQEEFPQETRAIWSGESRLMATIARWSWATISSELGFRHPIAIVASRWVHVSPHDRMISRFNLARLIVSLTLSTVPISARASDSDRLDSGRHNWCTSFDALPSDARDAATCPTLRV